MKCQMAELDRWFEQLSCRYRGSQEQRETSCRWMVHQTNSSRSYSLNPIRSGGSSSYRALGRGEGKKEMGRKIGVRNRHISQLRNTRPGSGSLATLASYYLQQKQTLQLNFYLLKELLTNSLAFSSIFSPSLSKILWITAVEACWRAWVWTVVVQKLERKHVSTILSFTRMARIMYILDA